jgi:V/A-type H+-transporting ATPase subunit A
VHRLIERDYPFKDKEEARKFFTELTRLLKNLNYASQGSTEYTAYMTQIEDLVKTLGRTSTATTKTPP